MCVAKSGSNLFIDFGASGLLLVLFLEVPAQHIQQDEDAVVEVPAQPALDLPSTVKYEKRYAAFKVKFKDLNYERAFKVNDWHGIQEASQAAVAWAAVVESEISALASLQKKQLVDICTELAIATTKKNTKPELMTLLLPHRLPVAAAPPQKRLLDMPVCDEQLAAMKDCTKTFLAVVPEVPKQTVQARVWVGKFAVESIAKLSSKLNTSSFGFLLGAEKVIKSKKLSTWVVRAIYIPVQQDWSSVVCLFVCLSVCTVAFLGMMFVVCLFCEVL